MSDHAHAPTAHGGGGLGSKLGKALWGILLVALFFMVLPAVLGMLFGGATSSVGAVSGGFSSMGSAITAMESGFKIMTRSLLSFVITVVVYMALGVLAFKIVQAIIAYAKH